MVTSVLNYGLQYGGMLIEAALLVFVLWGGQLKRRAVPGFYVALLLIAAIARNYALRRFGFHSLKYYNVYWVTDFLLVMSAFMLVCLFFRRGCLHEQKMWPYVRWFLVFTFLLVLGISGFSFHHHFSQLFSFKFVDEFNQNLYFTCLVLNTLLYILLQQIDTVDDELGLLVCGVGIQFAGPAASLALLNLATGSSEHFARSLISVTIPLCTIGMLVVWAYALVRVRDTARAATRSKAPPVLAEVTADVNF